MLNMDHTTLTPRRLEALVAVYLGGSPHQRVANNGALYWNGVRSRAGGAARRMVNALYFSGYLTKRDKLTAKGYDAIIAHVGGYLAKLINPAEIEQRRYAQELYEAETKQLKGREVAVRRAARRLEKLDALRDLFTEYQSLFRVDADHGVVLDYHADDNDDRLLEFADRIAEL